MKIIVATAFAFLLGAGVVWAEEMPAPVEPGAQGSGSIEAGGVQAEGSASTPFATLDENKDGSISKAEAEADADLKTAFDDADEDGDGKLSETEATAALEAGEEEEEAE